MNPADPTQQVPVAIIGMGCLFPKAENLSDYWSNIRNRVDAIGEVPESHWRPEDYFDADPKAPDRTYARRGGFLSPVDFPPLDFGIAPNNLEATDTTQLLGLMVARQALEDAGYGEGSTKPLDRGRVSVILGVTGTLELVIPLGARLGHPIWRRALKASGVPETQAEEVVKRIADSYVGWQENSFPGLLGNVAAGRIANRLDLGGTNCVIDAACASSVGALNLALLELAAGRCDLALTGGLDTFNDIFMYMCFSKTPALSPNGNARPFDSECDGTILGEGLGILALKRLDDARRDGDTVYAVIRGVGSSSDGKGNAVYAPSAAGQVRALEQAYSIAGTPADTIELVEAHGTGTKVGDATELKALNEVYRGAREKGTWCALGSVKSQIGHTKAAAGAAGLIKAALALHHKVLPPTIKVDRPLDGLSPGQSPFYVNTEARPWLPRPGHPRRAAVSAFGFGGSNYHCVLEEAEPAKSPIDWDGKTQSLAFSADSKEGRATAIDGFPRGLKWDESRTEAARSRGAFQPLSSHRLTVVIRSEEDLEATLERARKVVLGSASPRDRQGIFVGSGSKPGKLAMLFPGQGSQYVGMLREMACVFPQVQEALAQADAAGALKSSPGADSSDDRLSDRIYPIPVFSEAERAVHENSLRDTAAAQPAIGALSIGLFRVLADFGIHPDAVAGHSFGELTALRAAGRIDSASFAMLARERGRLMAAAARDGKGAMLAVLAPLDTVVSTLREENLDLVIANKNGPRQCVLSGRLEEIERATRIFESRRIAVRPLPVSAAFHSPDVDDACIPFLTTLRTVDVSHSDIPIYANATASLYPLDAAECRELLADQIRWPVEFVAEIKAMAAAGVGLFVEVGPDSKLTALVRSILEDREPGNSALSPAAISVDASRGVRGNLHDLALVLAELSAFGYPVALDRWDDGPARLARPPRKPGLTVKVSGANARPTPSPEPAPTSVPVIKPEPVPAASPTSKINPPMIPTPPRSSSPGPIPQGNGEHRPSPIANGVAANGRHQENGNHVAPVPRSQTFVPIGSGNPALIAKALQTAQENLIALQQLSQQSADLHRQFLEGQDRSQRSFQSLLDQQQRLTLASLGGSAPLQLPLPQPSTFRRGEPGPMPAAVSRLAAPLINGEPRTSSFSPPAEARPLPVEHPKSASPAPKPLQKTNQVSTVLLEVVAEKTGYPVEMLEPGMQLDADLGIDSIKRVEILSALQERLPDSPAVTPEHLGTLRTLKDIADFLTPTTPAAIKTPIEPASSLMRFEVKEFGLECLPGATGSLVRPEGEFWVTDDGLGLSASIVKVLSERGYRARLFGRDAVPEQIKDTNLNGLVIVAPTTIKTDENAILDAFRWLRAAGPSLRRTAGGGQSILVTVSRLDGSFGLRDLSSDADPTLGGFAGLCKTAGREWPEVLCKAIDLAPSLGSSLETVNRLVDEILFPGPTEVGLTAEGRNSPGLHPASIAPENSEPLAPGDLVVITGGARSVTAEVAVALADQFRCTLLLLGRSPIPHAEPAWLGPLEDEPEIKRALASLANGHATPQLVGDQFKLLAANREILRNLKRIEDAGGKALYRQVDVRDPAAVSATLAEVRREHGPVRALIHGAGVLADRRIEEKTDEQFNLVYNTKVQGFQSLLGAAVADDLRLIVAFSSTTARFGRIGQVAYAAANEALNKLAQRESRRRRDCRVVAVNWGPWDGGMVSPHLKPLFKSEGIGLIPLREGARYLVSELRSAKANSPVEIVILGPNSTLPEPPVVVKSAQISRATSREVSAGLITPTNLTAVFSGALDVEELPILRSHVIDGRAVLPTALMLEWLAQGAIQRNPGLTFVGIDNLRILKGAVVKEDRPETVTVLAGRAVRDGLLYRVPVELRGELAGSKSVLHARGEVLLGDRLATPETPPMPLGDLPSYQRSTHSVYHNVLFHGPDLHGLEQIDSCALEGILATARTAPKPSAWMQRPLRQSWLTDPLVIDCAFQLMVLWCHENAGGASLPTALGRFRQFRRDFPGPRIQIVARVERPSESRATADLDFLDTEGNLVARIEGYECVIDGSLHAKFRRNRLPQVTRGPR